MNGNEEGAGQAQAVPNGTQEAPAVAHLPLNHNDDGAQSSNASTPDSPVPFHPAYAVQVPSTVIKNGDVIKYTLNVMDAETGALASSVKRQYEDFEYLDHCLTTGNKIDGLIVPPVPPRPLVDAQHAEEASKKILGTGARGMMGDEFQRSCKQVERYLKQLLSHPVFGKDENLMNFLLKPEAPPRAKVKKGFLARLSGSLEARHAAHPDCDEFFQKQRDWLQQYTPVISDANDKFDALIAAEYRMVGQLTHLCTALSFSLYPNSGANALHNQFQSRFSDALNAVKDGFEVMVYNDEGTFGLCLDWYSRSMESLNAMLFRRTCLLVDYEGTNKNLDKAKPHKKEEAEKLKQVAEKAFEECSDVASLEIKKFHRARVQDMKEAIVSYATAQAMASKDTYDLLSSAYAKFKELSTSLSPGANVSSAVSGE